MNSSGTELLVASSTGIGVRIKKELIQAFERLGIEILGINQCQDVMFENSKSLEFLKGGSPTWEIFHYNESGTFIDSLIFKITYSLFDLSDQIIFLNLALSK